MRGTSFLESLRVSARYLISNFTGQTVSLGHQTLASEIKNVLAIVIQHEGEYLFIKVPQQQQDDASLRPILVDVDDVLENHLASIKAYLHTQLRVQPEHIRFSPYTFTLAPLTQVKLYLSLVTVSEETFAAVKSSFQAVPANKILLGRDNNIFFEAIARDYDIIPA